MTQQTRPELYTRYPVTSVLIYHGATVAHYALGGAGIIIGYGDWAGALAGGLYLAFAFIEMYVHMPLTVCPSCVYYRLEGSRCISALNLYARYLGEARPVAEFQDRAAGPFCANNLYIAALAVPIVAVIPALFLNFSIGLLVIWLALLGLMAFRFFVIFSKVACVHCRAQQVCPQAQQMGFSRE
jgi:hypothetical protein